MNQQEKRSLRPAADGRESIHTFAMDPCNGIMVCEVSGVEAGSCGQMAQLRVHLGNVCPGRPVALGMVLYETDETGCAQTRGMRTLLIPAHHEPDACDILVRDVWFVLPEALSMAGQDGCRHFRVHVAAHYADVEEAHSSSLRA